MPRPKGLPKTGGKVKGSKHKVSEEVRQTILRAYVAIGGDKALAKWAQETPTEFFKIYSKLLPIESHLSGPGGDPIPVDVTEAKRELLGRLAPRLNGSGTHEQDGETLQ